MAEMMTHLGNQDWTAAENIYTLGGNSGAKATFTIPAPDVTIDRITHTPTAVANTYRNLKGFSTAADSKMSGQVHFLKFRSYYGNAGDYGDQVVVAALTDVPTDFDGDGNQDALDVSFTSDGSIDLAVSASKIAARKEISKKAAAYMNVWMYTIREMEDAIDDCTRGCINCNDDP